MVAPRVPAINTVWLHRGYILLIPHPLHRGYILLIPYNCTEGTGYEYLSICRKKTLLWKSFLLIKMMRQFLDQQAPITFDHGTSQGSNREDYKTFGCEYQSSLQWIHSNVTYQTVADQSNDSGEEFAPIPVDPKQSTSDSATKHTGSQKTSKKAVDIAHFFVVVTREDGEMKRICKECG